MRIKILLIALVVFSIIARSEDISTFEMRYLTRDAKADGVTDFHGPTEWLSLEQRLDVLDAYANFASRFWGNPAWNKPLVTLEEIQDRLRRIKSQPLPSIRREIPLVDWLSTGYREGKRQDQERHWEALRAQGARIEKDCMILEEGCVAFPLDSVNWRFRMYALVKSGAGNLTFSFLSSGRTAVDIEVPCAEEDEAREVQIYGDLENHRIVLTIGGEEREYPLPSMEGMDELRVTSSSQAHIGRLAMFAFLPKKQSSQMPYTMHLVFNEDFHPAADIDGWTDPLYNDSSWQLVSLPACHGGLQEAGEDFLLRKKIRVGRFERAFLDIENITHSGEVWVNGRPVCVSDKCHPLCIDISKYLRPEEENTIAVRVDAYRSKLPTLHAPSDPNIGWVLGRTKLILTSECHILRTSVFTSSLDNGKAVQHNQLVVNNPTTEFVPCSVDINYYPWYPEEGPLAATVSRSLELRSMQDNVIDIPLEIFDPQLWSTSHPSLYRVEVILRDKDGRAMDDYVTTTGIRTIRQREGNLYINGKVALLEGAQIMGFRMPIETSAKTVKCPTDEMIMREMMLIQKMNGNLLRIHVHAEKDIPEGTNDPRFAEYADQMGMYLLWQTGAWIREGEAWNIDFEGYPRFMKQVFNHPSIVMWEASNHPNRFKQHDYIESRDFIRTVYSSISQTDSSRLISPTSFWPHMHFGNYEGTKDYKGNSIPQEPLLLAPLMVRGSQDAYSGYTNNWGSIRTMPNSWAKSCLEAHDQCYFNFEHEESTAQPNWELAKNEPWYQQQSYEWSYDEGTIGRKLEVSEWCRSQAYQSFSAWESMKKQLLLGYDGFSWCTIESGANMFTYQKPLVDPFCVPKLAWYANRDIFRPIWAASEDVDVVYGPGDEIAPVIFNMDASCRVDLCIELRSRKGKLLEKKWYREVEVPEGRSITRLKPFRFRTCPEDCCFLVYRLIPRS